jgi:hypothetical protein
MYIILCLINYLCVLLVFVDQVLTVALRDLPGYTAYIDSHYDLK